MSSNQANNDQELKNMVINSLPEACRQIGRTFFECLETRAKEVDSTITNEKQFEAFMNETAIPKCLSEYNLEECLIKNQKN